MRPHHHRVEDVRRFFQSPVDAAPGTVVVVNTAAIARRSAAGYHHRTIRPHSTFALRTIVRASALVSARPTSRSIGPAPDERGYNQVENTRKKRRKRKRWWWWCSELALGHALHVLLFRDLKSRRLENCLFPKEDFAYFLYHLTSWRGSRRNLQEHRDTGARLLRARHVLR
ncbi:hypothetical protein ALC62_01115 [Cyphomyrmex costatus]|uniref:Uncharacterized protein n=1 Tax=Cyphomyrmex costatus TaxID=456900 RepID=A0A195D4X3_9HYME|nr:hypothetical protein ALC62_01115 [Cyphomyrmex costatus]